ncbi:hypothetical protein [Terrihabitans sp. B22-R8]|uniref:hypothetical protein n=1 Tax=Terrihabitans sp. B22-R8 TaxID=3425128 RepID=UPI00403D0557
MVSRTGRLIAAAAFMLFATPVLAQSATDRLGVPGPVSFDSKAYALAWSAQPSPAYFKQEYVPAGQSVKTYTDMFLIEAVAQKIRPVDAASSQIATLNGRKGSDPVVNYDVVRNDRTGEVLLDFVISDLKANPVIVEWNAYRYVPLKGRDGVALYAISRRAYGEADAKTLLQGLQTWRSKTINALAGFEAPPVKLPK